MRPSGPPARARFAERAARLPRAAARIGVVLAIAAPLACERPVPASSLPARLAALERPNLVLILVDTLRADWTSPYGDPHDTSPELARWAEHGILFERARSQSSWTKISMASLLTSLWPRSHGIREPDDGLGEGAVTLAQVLRQGGYRTYGVQTNGWLDQSFGFQRGFDHYVFPRGVGAGWVPKASVWPHARRVYDEAVRLLEAHPEDRPFFLYLHFMDVHEYAAPQNFKTFGTSNEGAYRAAIRWTDEIVKELRKALDAAGHLDRTVLFFASDHGEAFGENGRHGHARNVLTSTLWVPLVIRLPFPVEPIRIPTQVANVDIAPTLVELAGLPVPSSFEGRSLLPLVSGAAEADARRDRLSYAGLGAPLFPDASVQESIHDGAWTYAIDAGPQPKELLFDRRVDPGENVNLIDREPAEATRMRSLLERYRERQPEARVRRTDVRIDPSIARRLRAMGYLQDEPDPADVQTGPTGN